MPSRQVIENCEDSTRYQAAKALLRRKVLSGEVGHGEQLKPELDLCRDLNLSRTTVRKAVASLVEEGLLVRQRGRGSFVNFSRTAAQQRLLAFLMCQNGFGAVSLLVQGAQQRAAELGYQLVLAESQNDAAVAFEQVVRLNETRVAGTIIAPLQTLTPERTTAAVVRALRQADQRVVLVDDFSADDAIPSICSQNREAMHKLTCHLIKKGYRRIAFLSSVKLEGVMEREEGFCEAMREHGIEVPPEYFLEVANRDTQVQGRQEVDVFMAMRQPPEAIVCLHDLIALNVMRRCEERGWRVPDDVAVVGFDDLPQAAVSNPPLTTMHQPLLEMGRRAVELLVRQLEGETLTAHHERLPCNFKIRRSCGSGPGVSRP
ncbi:MAG: transcriptional regulator [Verrucomicrobia bacterium 61-8]|nr:GntR family transcriptional regulator [Verrucomicrobiota bacterium]OJV17761.1 MAG: transcriptional regulator [Verrucomicrobia bacterium 61-8]